MAAAGSLCSPCHVHCCACSAMPALLALRSDTCQPSSQGSTPPSHLQALPLVFVGKGGIAVPGPLHTIPCVSGHRGGGAVAGLDVREGEHCGGGRGDAEAQLGGGDVLLVAKLGGAFGQLLHVHLHLGDPLGPGPSVLLKVVGGQVGVAAGQRLPHQRKLGAGGIKAAKALKVGRAFLQRTWQGPGCAVSARCGQ